MQSKHDIRLVNFDKMLESELDLWLPIEITEEVFNDLSKADKLNYLKSVQREARERRLRYFSSKRNKKDFA